MKNIGTLVVLCLIAKLSAAQKIVEKHLNFSQKTKTKLNIQIADSINVMTWNKKEVYVKASIDINDNKDNDDYELTFNESGNYVEVKAKFIEQAKKRNKNSNNCCCYNSRIFYDVYIPENSNFSLETINANIIITGKTAEIEAHTISGFIDLTLASDTKADFKLNTISGTIYSNIALNTTGKSRLSNSNITDSFNGGGRDIDLKTISGDIFFRKSE